MSLPFRKDSEKSKNDNFSRNRAILLFGGIVFALTM
jgi:hypothetical protein